MYLEQWLYGPGMPRKGFFFLWLMTRQSRMNIFYSHALVFTHFPQIWSNAISGLKYRLIRIFVESRFYNYSGQIVFFDEDQLYYLDTTIYLKIRMQYSSWCISMAKLFLARSFVNWPQRRKINILHIIKKKNVFSQRLYCLKTAQYFVKSSLLDYQWLFVVRIILSNTQYAF